MKWALGVVLVSWWASARRPSHGADVAKFVRDRRDAADQQVGTRSTTTTRTAGRRRSVVVYRTHVVDALTVSIGASMAASLRGSEYDLVVLYDSDIIDARVAGAVARAMGNGTRVWGLGLAGLVARYAQVPARALSKSHFQQLAYAAALAEHGGDYAFAWCVEHDVALTGGRWLDLFRDHDEDDEADDAGRAEDLLAWRVGWTPKVDRVHGGGTWNAGMLFGAELRPLTRDRKADVAFLFGAVVRLSRRFVDLLDGLARRGTFGHSEVAVPTICNETAWCAMANLSSRWVGLNEYRLPVDVGPLEFRALENLAPDRLFHPVRESKSASSRADVQAANDQENNMPEKKTTDLLRLPWLLADYHVASSNKKTQQREAPEPPTRAALDHARFVALCLLKNPRPPRPSFNCPVGCPHHHQTTCPVVNCIWGNDDPASRYRHLAAQDCIVRCTRRPEACPYDTS